MFYETAHTIGPGWHKSFKPSHYEDMTWSPSSKHFRSPGGSPQNYRRIIHPDDSDRYNEDDQAFDGRCSPTFPRKIFRDVWDDTHSSNHRFGDRPRMFKRVFKPNRWEDDDDDFERTRSSVRQMVSDFSPEFDSRKLDRDFDSEFHHRDRDIKSDIEEEFEKAAGRVHHIPIMVERRLDEMRSRFGRTSPPLEKADYPEESDEWQGPQVQRLKKNFERDEFSPLHRHRVPRADLNKPRAFTSPIPSKWDPDSVHTLPIRRSNKTTRLFDEPHSATPKSVFRSYSETHEDIPKHQQQHATAFRSHSDGHCPKTTYVTKISVNLPSNKESNHPMTNGDIKEEPPNHTYETYSEPSEDGWDSHQSRFRTRSNTEGEPKVHQSTPSKAKEEASHNDSTDSTPEMPAKKSEEKAKDGKRTSMHQISAVLQNVDDLIVHVEAYNGTGRDKQFRFLDEMLTRCMLRLDDVDTEGREDIRTARKAAVMQVQFCIEKLEIKANECEKKNRNKNVPAEPLSISDQEANPSLPSPENENAKQPSSPQADKETDQEVVSKPEDNEQTRL